MGHLSRDEILARRVHGNTETVTLSDGATVVVRGLSRGEARRVDLKGREDPSASENLAVSCALVEPALSLEDVEAWAEVADSDDFQRIAEAVQRLNKVGKTASKESTKSVPRQRRGRG
jgi:hypothetical protein